MILSNSETREEIISTLNVAPQGFLYVGANAELALHVFSFILHGGSHFPSAIRDVGAKLQFKIIRHSPHCAEHRRRIGLINRRCAV
jgi:hypothetical protein